MVYLSICLCHFLFLSSESYSFKFIGLLLKESRSLKMDCSFGMTKTGQEVMSGEMEQEETVRGDEAETSQRQGVYET